MKAKSLLIKILLVNIFIIPCYPVFAQYTDSGEYKESFIILAGKKTTEDGSILVAHNKGLTGKEVSFLQRRSREQHDSAEVIRLRNGLELPQTNITMAWMGLQTQNGVQEGDAVAVNQHQVSIAGSVSLRNDRNMKARKADPLNQRGVTGRISYIAMERARSARECVKLMGEYFNKYGIATPIGIAIADKNEVWYMETGGGRHWAAIKIPDDAIWVQANGYRIGHINPDNIDVMASPDLREFASRNGMWNPDSELFDFADVFGGRMQKMEGREQYNSLRIWRAISLLDSTSSISPDQKEFPYYIRPEKKVSLSILISILRDHYQGTPYNTFQNDSIASKIRAIASPKVVHTSIVQLTNGLPANVGAVLWAGFSVPLTTPYIPFYFGIKNVPKPYDHKTPDKQKAFHVYKSLADRFYQNPLKYKDIYPEIWSDFQNKCIREQINIDQGAMRLYRMQSDMARYFITVNVDALSQEALDIAKERMNRED